MTNKTLMAFSLQALAGVLAAQTTTPPAQTPPATTTPTTAPDSGIDWKDLTKSGIPIQFYGFLRLDAYYNTSRMDSVVIPTRVLAENGTTAKKNDDQFHLDPRLTRLGVDVKPGKIGGTTVSGKIEMDFANYPTGVSESRPTPRMRVAYVDLVKDELGFRAGQDWDVISPIFPAVNGEMLMWNAGNLGDRRAQIAGRYTPAESGLEVKAALGLTGAINNQDLDTPVGERDGFDSGQPHLQARAGYKRDMLVEKKPADIGAWGIYGQVETDTFFNGENRFDTWAVGLDWTLPLTPDLTFRGEAWTGANLGDVRGGIGQTINTTLGEEIASTGGWGELAYAVSPKFRLHGGVTIDDPDNGDLSAGNAKLNHTAYLGAIHDMESGLRVGFDVIGWETKYVTLGDGDTFRFNLYFQFNF